MESESLRSWKRKVKGPQKLSLTSCQWNCNSSTLPPSRLHLSFTASSTHSSVTPPLIGPNTHHFVAANTVFFTCGGSLFRNCPYTSSASPCDRLSKQSLVSPFTTRGSYIMICHVCCCKPGSNQLCKGCILGIGRTCSPSRRRKLPETVEESRKLKWSQGKSLSSLTYRDV